MESVRHKAGKLILGEILRQNGYCNISYEVEFSPMRIEGIGERTYIADIRCEKEGRNYIFEVDGKKGHSTSRDHFKMRLRDETFKSIGYTTIRIPLSDITSRKKKPDYETIIAEIDYQLNCRCVNVNPVSVNGNTTDSIIN